MSKERENKLKKQYKNRKNIEKIVDYRIEQITKNTHSIINRETINYYACLQYARENLKLKQEKDEFKEKLDKIKNKVIELDSLYNKLVTIDANLKIVISSFKESYLAIDRLD